MSLFDDCIFVGETKDKRIFFVECPDLKCRYKEVLKVERLKKR